MKQVQIELPDSVAARVEALVRSGMFSSKDALVQTAILEFLRDRRLELAEEFQREDIAWALQQKSASR